MTVQRRTSSAPERLRAAIDGGATGDKVAALDPAAAPLGTDAEAAGTPMTEEVTADRHESQSPPRSGYGADSRALLPGTVIAISSLGGLAVLLWAILS